MDSAKLGLIHPTAIIGPEVQIGFNVEIGPYTVITGTTIIGDNTKIENHVSIGTPPEQKGFFHKLGRTVIGRNCIIREFVTINSGTEDQTILGDDCIILRGSHIGHDSVLGKKVQLSCDVQLAGRSRIDEGATLGMGALQHQWTRVGAYSMIGMGAVITKKEPILPGWIYVGNPARKLKKNLVGLQRNDISEEMLRKFEDDYQR